ncbi:hypothetical protein [Methylobacterium sp. WL9]|uniref:hypothetical protein n=1 Tax=Methylobacterium sp. WL9 TaxID=2603898 RepID=UPI0011CB92F7|nr:hypothetical protein [Methylobacterium sp. WL9]TXN21269.1 hypothetical protein FV217_14835 [Methylobacterium sp. WL9]
MSGPKVVRIVTREEIEAICRQHMAQLDEAIDALRRVAARLDRLDADLETELARQRQILASQFAAERWAELQKRAPELIAGLQTHKDRIREAAAGAAAEARTRSRRFAEGARALVRALEAQGLAVDQDLRQATASAFGASAEKLAVLEAAMNGALGQLRAAASPLSPASGQRELAQRLAAGAEQRSLASWLATAAPADPCDARLDALLADIETRGGAKALQRFADRAASIAAEADFTRRAVLTDSLCLDAGRWVADQRAHEAVADRLRGARATLGLLASADAQALSKQVAGALYSADFQHAEKLCAAAEEIAEREAKSEAASARRRAVLSGLATLGYEVRESMATAWAQDGRLFLRKPASADYGVELGASANLDRLQIRVVGADQPSQPRTTERDRDQEVIWCGEFNRLRANLAARGSDLIIERALGVGAQPVKSVAIPSSASTPAEASVPISRRR